MHWLLGNAFVAYKSQNKCINILRAIVFDANLTMHEPLFPALYSFLTFTPSPSLPSCPFLPFISFSLSLPLSLPPSLFPSLFLSLPLSHPPSLSPSLSFSPSLSLPLPLPSPVNTLGAGTLDPIRRQTETSIREECLWQREAESQEGTTRDDTESKG